MNSEDISCSIILPTYREYDNLVTLIPRILENIPKLIDDFEIIIVDDSSGDGTASIGTSMFPKEPVHVHQRSRKFGLADAILTGITLAKYDICIIMDADHQHPPEVIPRLIHEIKTNDIVIASRLAPEGSMGDMSKVRQFVSIMANELAKIAEPNLKGVSDLQSGFFCIKSELLDTCDIKPVGFKILLEILARCDPESIEEVPYEFQTRQHGSSKLDMSTLLSYIYQVIKLKF
jgi:dolichol-phosphate mannosyltransferase